MIESILNEFEEQKKIYRAKYAEAMIERLKALGLYDTDVAMLDGNGNCIRKCRLIVSPHGGPGIKSVIKLAPYKKNGQLGVASTTIMAGVCNEKLYWETIEKYYKPYDTFMAKVQ